MERKFSVILTELEDMENAKKAYQRGLQIDPNCIALRVNFAIFEYRHGNVDAAREWLGDLLENPVPNTPQYTVRCSSYRHSHHKIF